MTREAKRPGVVFPVSIHRDNSRRVTQGDIALAAGVTQPTVSLALRNDPSVIPRTRERILALARELGYMPDPYLSGLAAYRARTRPPVYQATLAWLTNYPGRNGWRTPPQFVQYHEGAVERAAALGYRIEEHWLGDPGMTPAQIARILRSRNIGGILVVPQPDSMAEVDFPWQNFSAVGFGYTLVKPALHLVTTHQYRAARLVYRRLWERGYRRIGLALERSMDDRVDNMFSAGVASLQIDLPADAGLEPFLDRGYRRGEFLAWFEANRPDALIIKWPATIDWLRAAGHRVPEDVGVAFVALPPGATHFAGIDENSREVGRRAADKLIELIRSGERGPPALPMRTLIEGSWREGQTIRPAV